ncbi:MAG: toprim domain-containing protein [Saprospiraceae bacterium]|nr:toprim domain-containing protein [Saprospiraceae bacterium]
MNSTQAKKIPLQEILAKLGLQAVKSFKGGEELAFLSPFRKEKEASLFVNIRKNVWYDFGDIGGNALDFVIRYRNTDVRGALEFLEQMFGRNWTPPPTPEKPEKQEQEREEFFLLESITPFGTSANSLVAYITEARKINLEIAKAYLKEVRYSNRENGKKYFAVGFENISGGYEIRNPFFKSSLGEKDMSFIKGNGAGGEIMIFEGFMDFLSKLTLENVPSLSADALILNSVSYTEKAILFVREKGYQKILGFFDNDKAGNDASEKFKSEFGDLFFDMRFDYQEFKDLNEFLISI